MAIFAFEAVDLEIEFGEAADETVKDRLRGSGDIKTLAEEFLEEERHALAVLQVCHARKPREEYFKLARVGSLVNKLFPTKAISDTE